MRNGHALIKNVAKKATTGIIAADIIKAQNKEDASPENGGNYYVGSNYRRYGGRTLRV